MARSDTQKKRIWVRTATGMYSMRVRSMSFSVCSAILTLAWECGGGEGQAQLGWQRAEGGSGRGRTGLGRWGQWVTGSC